MGAKGFGEYPRPVITVIRKEWAVKDGPMKNETVVEDEEVEEEEEEDDTIVKRELVTEDDDSVDEDVVAH